MDENTNDDGKEVGTIIHYRLQIRITCKDQKQNMNSVRKSCEQF